MKNSQSEENYLKALFTLMNTDKEVSVSDLSTVLSVSMPSANGMVKRLDAKGYLVYQKYKPLRMTEKGELAAALVLRKHRLTEMFLVEKMDFGWEEVHDIAEQMEHIKSPDFFDRMDELLDFPTIDPHGSPIPDKSGGIYECDFKSLDEFEPKNVLVLRALADSSADLLSFLNKKGLKLGVVICIEDYEEFDETYTISYDNSTTIVSKKIAECLLVDKPDL